MSTLRICSFNIRNGDADDGPNSWPHRVGTVVEFLRRIDADIFGLQEVLSYQLEMILDALPNYVSVGVGRLDGSCEGEYSPILFRKDRLKLGVSGWFWISESPEIAASKSWDTACERICTWCDLDFEGHSVRVMNTHLDHVSSKAREKGAELIVSRTADIPTVVMGDFNALPWEPPVQCLVAAGFVESLGDKSTSTFHNWQTEEYGQIDYIFFRGISLHRSWVFTEKVDARDASDHYPVVAILQPL